MKGIKCFGVLLVLSIIVGSSLSVYLDANAVTYTVDLEPINTISVEKFYCKKKNDTTIYGCGGVSGGTTDFTSGINQTVEIQSFYSRDSYDIVEDQYYEFYFSILGLDNATYNASTGIIWQIRDNDNFALVTIEQVIDEVYWNNQNTQNGIGFTTGYDSENQSFRILLRAKRTATVPFMIGDSSLGTLIYQDSLRYQRLYVYPTVSVFKLKIDGAEEMNEKDDQDRQDIEQQSSTNEQDANDAGDEADQTGQTLMQAFGSLITALTSVHETNCTLPNMSVYSLDLDNIDLCAVGLPSGIAALVGIGMCLIIVPLGIHLVKKMINLYKEIVG